MGYIRIEKLIGKTLTSAAVNGDKDRISFEASDGSEYVMYHDQDCCESVYVEDVCGDLSDLVGSPILEAEKVVSANEWPEGIEKPQYTDDSYTWTFYKLGTNKGRVTVRWFGSSNGYYSEGVKFAETKTAN